MLPYIQSLSFNLIESIHIEKYKKLPLQCTVGGLKMNHFFSTQKTQIIWPGENTADSNGETSFLLV